MPARPLTHTRAFAHGFRDGLSVPGFVLISSFLGFGALIRQSEFTLFQGLLSTATGWALPAQIAMVELYTAGASFLVIALAVALTNVRLLPMTVVLMPILRSRSTPRWVPYVVVHWLAITGWAQALRVCPELPRPVRISYFMGFSMVLWPGAMLGTMLGYYLAGSVPLAISLGLVFLNPIYFMLVFASDLRIKTRVWALCLGAVLGPVLHLYLPDMSLLVTGLVAGSLAFVIGGGLSRKKQGNS